MCTTIIAMFPYNLFLIAFFLIYSYIDLITGEAKIKPYKNMESAYLEDVSKVYSLISGEPGIL